MSPGDTGKYDPPGAPITGYYIQGGPVEEDSPDGDAAFFVQRDGETLTSQYPPRPEVYYYSAGTDVPLTASVLRHLADICRHARPRRE